MLRIAANRFGYLIGSLATAVTFTAITFRQSDPTHCEKLPAELPFEKDVSIDDYNIRCDP